MKYVLTSAVALAALTAYAAAEPAKRLVPDPQTATTQQIRHKSPIKMSNEQLDRITAGSSVNFFPTKETAVQSQTGNELANNQHFHSQ